MDDYDYQVDTLPTTDEEVHQKFKRMYQDELTVSDMWGIYRSLRTLLGQTVLEAYPGALQKLLDAAQSKPQHPLTINADEVGDRTWMQIYPKVESE